MKPTKKTRKHLAPPQLVTGLTPQQLADYIGGTLEQISTGATTRSIIYKRKQDIDAAYQARLTPLCESLDRINAAAKEGRIPKDVERDFCYAMQWYMDTIEGHEKEKRALIGWLMEANEEIDAFKRRQAGSAGGKRGAAHWERVGKKAAELARVRGLADGRHSAEDVASIIEADVRAFARLAGRDFVSRDATRKIAEYLRAAGIKKAKVAP